MRKWKRVETSAGVRFRSGLEQHEVAMLRNLVGSLCEMLDERESSSPQDELAELTGITVGHSDAPDDDTMRRLLPDFYRNAGEHPAGANTAESLNSALRSLHEPTIIDAKREAAQHLLDSLPANGGRFELNEDQAQDWAAAVNDVRLALGVMLDVGPDGPQRLSQDHPLAGHLEVYQWLTYLQEYLVLSLMDER
ncbi:DUF2017 domain-containing protein [Mycobacterium sp. OTB74]|uniref:oxidative stress transcriptional regulator AosR n=1 Tax=Mycobacterium sp. OTB74 TaxID=1853452 RepID=UPI002475D748|nr:DUF2017 domain-containing protein [Mycobacterium sp. OTB74]MDH6245158.1 hypothetical protein [Mycobacterium sp. OTB74]